MGRSGDPEQRKKFAKAAGVPESMFADAPRNSAGEVTEALYANTGMLLGGAIAGAPGAIVGGWLFGYFGYALGETADYATGGALSRGLDAHPGLKTGLIAGINV